MWGGGREALNGRQFFFQIYTATITCTLELRYKDTPCEEDAFNQDRAPAIMIMEVVLSLLRFLTGNQS